MSEHFIGMDNYTERIFALREESDGEFTALALQAYRYQRENCKVYRDYLRLTGRLDAEPSGIEDIPFLPISLFKTQTVLSGCEAEEVPLVFTSSATTGMTPSRHFVKDLSVYERSFRGGFAAFYGAPEGYNLLALLPSYFERKGSSLVYMADRLIGDVRVSGGQGDFFLYNHDELLGTLVRLSASYAADGRRTIILGVAFALLDFAEYMAEHRDVADKISSDFYDSLTVIETGGMKGRGEELSRAELHLRLRNGLRTQHIHSEYGMAELMSQAYQTDTTSAGAEGFFRAAPWMRAAVRDLQNPFRVSVAAGPGGRISGGLNIIDLANIHSCCFVETEDRGTLCGTGDRSLFSVDGRIAHSELRGCNMLLGE